jgi:tRNA dimethylallyltransferase
MTNDKPKVIVITGPTASGKSTLAVELALHVGGEIVNADSMQVYRGMDVGTAKPTMAERRGVPHHLLDVVNPDEDFDAAKYRSLAIPQLKDMESRGKVPFVVGGTGLYIKVLLGGLLDCPSVDLGLREELGRTWEAKGGEFLYERLKELDPESALKIHLHDRVRIIRALEIIHMTRQRPSSLIKRHGFRDNAFDALKICIEMNRKELYERINQRSIKMIEGGLVEETEKLLKQGYSPELKPMKSLGYRHVVKYLKGVCALDETTCELQRDTRRYAKRQLTWFGADPQMVWVKPQDMDGIIRKIKVFQTVNP